MAARPVSSAARAAASALRELNTATNRARAANDIRTGVSAWELAGAVHDSVLSDPKSAAAAYQEALRLDPKAAKAGGEAARLSRVTENLVRSR